MQKRTPCPRPASQFLGQFGFRWLLPAFVFCISANFVFAQYAPGGTGFGGMIIADRNRTRVLKEAQELIAAGKYLDAVTYLQTLLEQDEDLLLRPSANDDTGVFRSMKAEVQRIIETLPAEGREVYLRNNGPLASTLLKEALEQNDDDKLAEVARLYYHTPAGYEATYRMGLRQFDHGEPMQAALILRRLQRNPEVAKRYEPLLSLRIALCWIRAGMPDEATAVFQSLRTSGKAQSVTLAGARRDLFTQSGEPSAWLAKLIKDQAHPQYANKTDWLFAGGSANRNAVLPLPKPTGAEPWQVVTVADPYYKDPEDPIETELDITLQSVVAQMRNYRSQSAPHQLPSRQPLVVDGMVLFRMLDSVRIHDLESGDFLLQPFGYDEILDKLIDPKDGEQIPNWKMHLGQLINQRLWDDGAYGRFSSDGERLYCIMGMGFWQPIPMGKNNDVIPVPTSNVLIAYDLKTGKVVWDVGGAPNDHPVRNLAGRYFLGPPLPLAGKLYGLVDANQEIQLNVLDAETGQLEWSQPLATPMQLSIDQDRARRASGVSVAYADGVLVCPTDAGAIVALDLTSRSLLWGFPTDSGNGNLNRPDLNLRRGGLQRADVSHSPTLPSGWIDSTPLIAGDKVILTPLKSSQIFLLDLLTGKRIWQQPRGQGLYVAGVLNNMAIVVGTKNVQTWNVHNDQTGWKEPLELSAVPTGRGVIVGSSLLLPAGKELLVVDLKTGAERQPLSVPENVELGNLVVAQGRLISQGVSTLDVIAFPNLDEAGETK